MQRLTCGQCAQVGKTLLAAGSTPDDEAEGAKLVQKVPPAPLTHTHTATDPRKHAPHPVAWRLRLGPWRGLQAVAKDGLSSERRFEAEKLLARCYSSGKGVKQVLPCAK